jgi:hypothetical protein
VGRRMGAECIEWSSRRGHVARVVEAGGTGGRAGWGTDGQLRGVPLRRLGTYRTYNHVP